MTDENKDILEKDLKKVSDAQPSERQIIDILTHQMDARAIKSLHSTDDPVRESFVLEQTKGLAGTPEEGAVANLRALNHMYISALKNAGMAHSILAGILNQPIHDRDDTGVSGQDRLHKEAAAIGELLSEVNLSECSERSVDLEAVLDSLLICATRTMGFREFSIASQRGAKDNRMKTHYRDESSFLLEISNMYYAQVFELASKLNELIDSKEPDQKKVGLRSALMLGAVEYSLAVVEEYNNPSEESTRVRKKVAGSAIKRNVSAISRYFQTDDGGVIKGSMKGDLHEAIYLTDMIFLLNTRPEAVGWQISPATKGADNPKVGYPKLRRGYDFIVGAGIFGKPVAIPIQLKSGSAGDDVEYHPDIRKLREMNFQDVNKRRLSAKIAAYERCVESGFDDKESETVEKYIVGTAYDTLGIMKKETTKSYSQFLLDKSVSSRGLNRESRRRLARNKKLRR